MWKRVRELGTTEWLSQQIARGDIAHAWLFLGPSGSGKRATAEVIAAALNCPVMPGVGCSECSTCLRTARRRHPDVHHIVPEGPLIPVDVIRESVIPEASRSPFEATYKVFIIEEADRMNESAQNALLKTLEEPQPDTVFFLLSDHEEELLETIHSRCRVVRFDPVPEARIVKLLEEEGAPAEEAMLAARLSTGDFERARALAFDPAARERRSLWMSIPRRLVSPVDALDAAGEITGTARTTVKALEKQQGLEVTELAEAMGEGRGTAQARNSLAKRHRRELRRLEEETLGQALNAIASFYRDVFVVRSGGVDAATNLDMLEEIESWAKADEISAGALIRAAERCLQARGSLPKNANQTLAIEATLVEIARLAPPPASVAARW
jgi:DNA polymerase-3 subunit delta'